MVQEKTVHCTILENFLQVLNYFKIKRKAFNIRIIFFEKIAQKLQLDLCSPGTKVSAIDR